jgi:hypothetical protein
MNDKQERTLQAMPESNYGSAVARAIEWLGDRYLLAKPINTRVQRPRSRIGHQELKTSGEMLEI